MTGQVAGAPGSAVRIPGGTSRVMGVGGARIGRP